MFKANSHGPIVFTPQFQTCWDTVTRIHQEQRTFGPTNITLVGVSGVGKSTFIRAYQRNYPRVREKDGVRIPVGSFSVPSGPTPRQLFVQIVKIFGGPVTGSKDVLRDRAIKYINESEMELLIADESNHMIDRGTMKSHAQLGDCWKELSDAVNCSIVLCGAPRLRLLFDTNNQLKNRWSESCVLRPFEYSEDLTNLAQLIVTLLQPHEAQRLKELILQGDTLNRIQYATDGIPALVVKLLERVLKLHNSADDVGMKSLDAAWNLPGTAFLPDHRRPFNGSFNFERLNGTDEPFFPSPFDGDNHAPYF